MKTEIITALTFPRSLIRGDVELENCSHAGHYAPRDRTCECCSYDAECAWLYSNDEFVALEDKPLEELEDALQFAVGYVDAQVSRWGHNAGICRCDACSWLRDGQSLIDRIAQRLSAKGAQITE